MSLEIGTRVEVIQKLEGLEGSYYAGVVIDRTPEMRKVRYETLQTDDGTLLEETISRTHFRLCPPEVNARSTIGDIVDSWHNDGWWTVRYTLKEGDNYIVTRRNIRFHHEWSAIRD